MNVKINRVHNDAIIPKKATPLSVGYDVYTCEDMVVEKGRMVIPLGFALEMPEGVEAKIEPRSGFSAKGIKGYAVVAPEKEGEWRRIGKPGRFDADVIVGKIDPDYTGEIGVIVKNNDESFFLPKGTRIAQMTFYKTYAPTFEQVNVLTATTRGSGGFGSTGTN